MTDSPRQPEGVSAVTETTQSGLLRVRALSDPMKIPELALALGLLKLPSCPSYPSA